MSPLLRVEDVHIRFGGVVAADGVYLDLEPGESLAIIGPNGAGKTTFLNICTGYLKPTAGRVLFEGNDITGQPPRAIVRLGIARAFQIPQLFLEHSVLDNMLIAAAARTRAWNPFRAMVALPERAEMIGLLRQLGVADTAEQRVDGLPEGVRKLVDVALALALKPRLLLLDEPTSGVSSSEKFQIMDALVQALKNQAVTSVFVEHDMEMVSRYAHRVAVWNGGRVQMVGTPADVLADADVRRDVVGI
ncbi:MAG: ATP-binding cassette domain-containing protein [Geminicoccaceae bacterium]|nr:MAG: ATP-binding cassette domain-containing protein [Geminicoccaceae bacterium]